jgi:hypothetical protein
MAQVERGRLHCQPFVDIQELGIRVNKREERSVRIFQNVWKRYADESGVAKDWRRLLDEGGFVNLHPRLVF